MIQVLAQFWRVLIGIMHKTVLELVCRRNISQKHTICKVFPKPIECANIQPKPVDVENLCTDSIMLSKRNLTPPIWNKIKILPLCKFIINLCVKWNKFYLYTYINSCVLHSYYYIQNMYHIPISRHNNVCICNGCELYTHSK